MAQQYIGTGRIDGTCTSISATSTSAQMTTVSAQTRRVRVFGNTAFHIAYGNATTVTATTASAPMPANAPEYITCNPGERFAVIRATTNGLVTATDGTVWVTEVP